MQLIENLIVKEKIYVEKMKNGLTVMVIPRKNTNKKYAIIGTHFGSVDNEFVVPGEEKSSKIPDGVAHFLEHKMFEQENGTNSLDVLSNIGVDANAYTTNDYTAYLIDATNNFDEAFKELMNYVQHPYFTDENVKKEQGIIEQEINMYEDDPGTRVYMEALKCMYSESPVRIDIAGSVQSINEINKEILYNCYNTFYNPSNMCLVICGDFKPEEIIKKVEENLVEKELQGDIQRVYPKEPKEVKNKESEKVMNVSQPIFVIGIKENSEEQVNAKKVLTVEIILEILLGKSSELYKKLYENKDLIVPLDYDYEFSQSYSHIIISSQAKDPKKIFEEIKKQVKKYIESGIHEEKFERIKKKIYGEYVMQYNDIDVISRNLLADHFKGIKPFEFIEEFKSLNINYANEILRKMFKEENMVISIVK